MYFRRLQIMRGLAALSVVLFHVNEYMRMIMGDSGTVFRIFRPIFSQGALFFFVVSGFLMAYLLDGHYKHFLARRLLRIFPTFWLAAAGAVALKATVFGMMPAKQVVLLMGLLPLGPKWSQQYPLGIEWTLVYEVFFYFVCAAFANKALYRWFGWFLLAWLAVIGVAAKFYHAADATWISFPRWYNVAVSPCSVLFIAGGLSYYVYRRIPRLAWWQAGVAIAAGVGLFAMTETVFVWPKVVAAFAGQQVDLRYGQLLVKGIGFALVLVALSVMDRGEKKREKPTVLEKFGDYSYALYLTHPTVINCFLLAGHPYTQRHNLLGITTVAACLAMGWWYGKVDMRLHDTFRRLLAGKPVKPLEPAGVTIAETVEMTTAKGD